MLESVKKENLLQLKRKWLLSPEDKSQDSVKTPKPHKSYKRKVVEQSNQNLEYPGTKQVEKEDREKQIEEDK